MSKLSNTGCWTETSNFKREDKVYKPEAALVQIKWDIAVVFFIQSALKPLLVFSFYLLLFFRFWRNSSSLQTLWPLPQTKTIQWMYNSLYDADWTAPSCSQRPVQAWSSFEPSSSFPYTGYLCLDINSILFIKLAEHFRGMLTWCIILKEVLQHTIQHMRFHLNLFECNEIKKILILDGFVSHFKLYFDDLTIYLSNTDLHLTWALETAFILSVVFSEKYRNTNILCKTKPQTFWITRLALLIVSLKCKFWEWSVEKEH